MKAAGFWRRPRHEAASAGSSPTSLARIPDWEPVLGPLLVGILVGALLAGRIETGLLCLGLGGLAAWAAGARRPPARWLATFVTGAVVAWALNLYLTPGTPLPGWPALLGRKATDDGLVMGALLTLRLAGAFVAVQGLGALWPLERAADEAARWMRPLERVGFRVSAGRQVIGLALRYAPLVADEARRIGRVQRLRAGRPSRGAREWLTWRRAAAVPLLVSSLERAERVALALEARHYRLRPLPPPGPIAAPELLAWVGAAGLALLSISWRR